MEGITLRTNWLSIKNFRSLVDTGKCYLSPNITILAGKNESGKTNILEGISKFNRKINFDSLDRPLYNHSSDDSQITLNFVIKKNELKEILEKAKLDINLDEDEYEFSATRSKEKDTDYVFSGPLFEQINEKFGNLTKEKLKKANAELNEAIKILSKYGIDVDSKIKFNLDDEYSDIHDKSSKFVDLIKNKIIELKDNIKPKEKEQLEKIKKYVNSIRITTDSESEILNLKDKLREYLPRIIIFSTFDDILPFEEEMPKLANLKIFKDFCKITGLNINQLQKTTDGQERRIILDSATATLEGDFLSYWKQDKITIKPEIDGNKLRMFFYDEGESAPFKPEQRSKGLLWFLSFYITLKAESKGEGGKNNIILIDEPGFYLHAKAQEDVLKILEDLAKENQVIFTTHMPYLINPHKLDRIRLVTKDKKSKETKIENSISKGADYETLKPIITAIGLDISKGLGIAKEKNIILEGISDYYYIQTMKKYLTENNGLEFPDDIYFIPSVGADKIPMLVPLFIGWGLKYSVVLDNDRKGKKVKKKLLEQGVPDDRIILVDGNNNCIEDLFSLTDFREYVIEEDIQRGDGRKNSEVIRDCQNGKALTAKLFHDRLHDEVEIQLNQTTIDNFNHLLSEIKCQFPEQNQ